MSGRLYCRPPPPPRGKGPRHKGLLQGLAGEKPREPSITCLTKPRLKQKPVADKRSRRLELPLHTYLLPIPPLPCHFAPVLPPTPPFPAVSTALGCFFCEPHPDLGCFFKAFLGPPTPGPSNPPTACHQPPPNSSEPGVVSATPQEPSSCFLRTLLNFILGLAGTFAVSELVGLLARGTILSER